jgi:hypothetical protein
MLDATLQSYWKSNGEDDVLASGVVTEALDYPPDSLKLGARVLQVADTASIAAGYKGRIDKELAPRVDELRHRIVQIDQLANRETDPQAIVEILGEEAEGLDWSSFDADHLRKERNAAGGKVSRAEKFLSALGWDRLPDVTQTGLRRALTDMDEQSRFQAQALLVNRRGDGFVLGLTLALDQTGDARSAEMTDQAMNIQIAQALHEVCGDSAGARYSLEWQLPLEGKSIGLAIVAAALVMKKEIELDPLTAMTGEVEVGGSIEKVSGIEAKLEAARAAGMRRVLLPQANSGEAERCGGDGLELLYASHVDQVKRLLERVPDGTMLASRQSSGSFAGRPESLASS